LRKAYGYSTIISMKTLGPVGVFFSLLAAIVLFPIPATAQQSPAADVRIGVFPAPPVSYVDDNGDDRGMSPDTLIAALTEFGLGYEIVRYPSFSQALAAVSSREIDLLGGLVKTPEREQLYEFNGEPFIVSWGQVYTAEDRTINSLLELRNLRVGLMTDGQNGINFLNTMEAFDIPFVPVYYDSHGDITEAILASEVDAGIFYNVYFLNENRIKPSDVVFSPTAAYFITDPGNASYLLDRIDRWLAEQKRGEDTEYNRIQQRYLSTEQISVLPPWVRSAMIAGAVALGVGLLFILLLRLRIAKMREVIRADEAKYSLMFNASGNGVLLVGKPPGRPPAIEDINLTGRLLFGAGEDSSTADFRGADPLQYFADRNDIATYFRDDRRGGETWSTRTWLRSYSGPGRGNPVEVRITSIEIAGEPKYLMLIHDLSSQYEEDLRYRTIADHIFGWEFWTDEDHNYLYVSPGAERITGYPVERFYADRNFINGIIHPDDLKLWEHHRINRNSGAVDDSDQLDFRLYHADGSLRWIEHSCVRLYDEQGECVGYRGTNHDVTERVLFEMRQQRDLQEKSLMMQEIHHRVKNNLQTIASLISIQADQIDDAPAARYLSEMAGRVQAMGELHKRLYQSEDLTQIDLKQYSADLVDHLRGSYSRSVENVKLEIRSPAVYSNMDTAIPFGLILNEAVTNAFKYAFDDGGGQVLIKLEQEGQEYRLVVHDSGRGFSEEILRGEGRGLGFQIMELLSAQLGGAIEFANDFGALIQVKFRRVEKEEKRWRRNE
jgi:PAS domain S-box-containing protein